MEDTKVKMKVEHDMTSMTLFNFV